MWLWDIILLHLDMQFKRVLKELDGRGSAKHRSQWPVIGWVTKIYYLELLRASEGTLSRWSRLHLQSLAPTQVSRRVDVRQAAGRKNNGRIFITTWWKTCCTDPTLWDKGRRKKIEGTLLTIMHCVYRYYKCGLRVRWIHTYLGRALVFWLSRQCRPK
jgi:hypothetical protein